MRALAGLCIVVGVVVGCQTSHVDKSTDLATNVDQSGSVDQAVADAAQLLDIGFDASGDAAAESSIALPAAVVAAGCTTQAFYDDFDDLHTIDLKDTRATGFNWYVYNATSGGRTAVANLTVQTMNDTTFLRLDPAGGAIYSATKTMGGTSVGSTFNVRDGHCRYFEARLAMGLVSATASIWPAYWLESSKHFENMNMPWAGDSNTAYNHFIEIDIMELATKYSYNARSTIIDWYGEYNVATTDCNKLPYCKTQNSQGLGPNVAGTYDSTDAAPVFHRFGAMWIPSVADGASYKQGSMTWFIDGKPLGNPVTWSGVPSMTAYVPVAPWLYSIADQVDVMIIANSGGDQFEDVDYIGVWQAQ